MLQFPSVRYFMFLMVFELSSLLSEWTLPAKKLDAAVEVSCLHRLPQQMCSRSLCEVNPKSRDKLSLRFY